MNTDKSSEKKATEITCEYFDNKPFIKLSGSHFEMGFQYGKYCSKEIKEGNRYLHELLDSFFKKKPWIFRPITSIVLNFMIFWIKSSLPKKYLEELKGMAKATEVPLKEIYFDTFFPEILSSQRCTGSLFSIEGRVVHGRNLDFVPSFFGRIPVVTEYSSPGKNSYVSIGIIGYTGVLTAMNEKGLSISVNLALSSRKFFAKGIPISIMIREIMENCKNFSELDAFIRDYSPAQGWIMTVGSAEDNSGRVYDIVAGDIRYTELENKVLATVNNFHDKGMAKKYSPIIEALCAQNRARLDRVNLLAKKVNTIDDVVKIFRDGDFFEYEKCIGMTDVNINNELTMFSVIFDNKNFDIYIATGESYAGYNNYTKYNVKTKYKEIALKSEPIIDTEKFKDFIKWNSKIIEKFLENDTDYLLNSFNWEDPNVFNVYSILKAAKSDSNIISENEMIGLIDRLILKYPEYAYLYLRAGWYLYEIKNHKKSIDYLIKGLGKEYIFIAEKIRMNYLLAVNFKNIQNINEAKKYASECLKIIKDVEKDFYKEKEIRKMERELLKI